MEYTDRERKRRTENRGEGLRNKERDKGMQGHRDGHNGDGNGGRAARAGEQDSGIERREKAQAANRETEAEEGREAAGQGQETRTGSRMWQ